MVGVHCLISNATVGILIKRNGARARDDGNQQHAGRVTHGGRGPPGVEEKHELQIKDHGRELTVHAP